MDVFLAQTTQYFPTFISQLIFEYAFGHVEALPQLVAGMLHFFDLMRHPFGHSLNLFLLIPFSILLIFDSFDFFFESSLQVLLPFS
jgi:hypothetical protein